MGDDFSDAMNCQNFSVPIVVSLPKANSFAKVCLGTVKGLRR